MAIARDMQQRGGDREPRVNRRIRVPEVRVISPEGEQLGIMPTHEALDRAQDMGLDLVEVAPGSRPPVCRIMDYGKYKYLQKKKQAEARKNQVQIQVKEVKFRPKIETHDFEFKLRHVERFLAEGNKVKVTIMFRGREMAHTELGRVILERVIEELKGKVNVEAAPRLEGRNMHTIVSPRPGAYSKVDLEEDKRESPTA